MVAVARMAWPRTRLVRKCTYYKGMHPNRGLCKWFHADSQAQQAGRGSSARACTRHQLQIDTFPWNRLSLIA